MGTYEYQDRFVPDHLRLTGWVIPENHKPQEGTPAIPWTDVELALFDDPALTVVDIARRTGRSETAVHRKRSNLGKPKRRRKGQYTPEEIAVVMDMTLSLQEIADKIGRTYESVRVQRQRQRSSPPRIAALTAAKFDEVLELVEVQKMTHQAIANHYGVGRSYVRDFIWRARKARREAA